MKWRTILGWGLFAMMAVAIGYLYVSAAGSPVDATYDFLMALQKKDSKWAGRMTWLPKGSPSAEEQWRELFQGKLKTLNFGFYRKPLMADIQGDGAVVKLTMLSKPYVQGGSPVEDDIQFPLRRDGGSWKVDVTRLARNKRLWTSLPN